MMRWNHKPMPVPSIGDTRKVRTFAYLPILISDTWVWLEKVIRTDTYSEWTEEIWNHRESFEPIKTKYIGWLITKYDFIDE